MDVGQSGSRKRGRRTIEEKDNNHDESPEQHMFPQQRPRNDSTRLALGVQVPTSSSMLEDPLRRSTADFRLSNDSPPASLPGVNILQRTTLSTGALAQAPLYRNRNTLQRSIPWSLLSQSTSVSLPDSGHLAPASRTTPSLLRAMDNLRNPTALASALRGPEDTFRTQLSAQVRQNSATMQRIGLANSITVPGDIFATQLSAQIRQNSASMQRIGLARSTQGLGDPFGTQISAQVIRQNRATIQRLMTQQAVRNLSAISVSQALPLGYQMPSIDSVARLPIQTQYNLPPPSASVASASLGPSAPSASVASASLRHLPVMLYLPCDDESLTPYQCLARKQIELFGASQSDVEAGTQGRNRSVVVGQVGIRCRHCCKLSFRERTKGSTYYPPKLDGIYQAAQNMCNNHLTQHCNKIPEEIREELRKLGNKKSAAGGGKNYWSGAAKILGVVEDEHGLRFCDRSTQSNRANS